MSHTSALRTVRCVPAARSRCIASSTSATNNVAELQSRSLPYALSCRTAVALRPYSSAVLLCQSS
eukprot:11210884-Lingulodinium_polyedra.AAC.1